MAKKAYWVYEKQRGWTARPGWVEVVVEEIREGREEA